ncbi:DUF2169 family type VI secretion system accessory protein [Myxococcus xanthus]|uniref:DUF2169 family type VI secretion system accessory protein n=1 Tax=Myxococcus xanthus TaxID=34 RepID=UPI00112A8074|nr:DUF2169 domain-containing protein [Myxococcus xanthus]QDF06528.1 hypothetical protein BHS04_25515 [Myxococcus xanthus]
MGHPRIENETPFVFEPLPLADEEMRPLLTLVVKATFDVKAGQEPTLAPEQVPLQLAGKRWEGSELASYRYEPEAAFFKPATDVALVGHAHASQSGQRELVVSLQVGPVQKSVRVLGDRVWVKSLSSISMTQPIPFETIPLQYERAFGGWDRSHPEPAHHAFDARNPIGRGFRARHSRFEEGLRLPNLEEPLDPIRSWGQRPAPAGFGFLSPEWQPRASFAGTYDSRWNQARKPLLPADFDRRFFNAAAPALIAPAYLNGTEPITVINACAAGRLGFKLPGLPPPQVLISRLREPDTELRLNLDTVIIDTDAMHLMLIWRGMMALRRDPTEVTALRVTQDGAEKLTHLH